MKNIEIDTLKESMTDVINESADKEVLDTSNILGIYELKDKTPQKEILKNLENYDETKKLYIVMVKMNEDDYKNLNKTLESDEEYYSIVNLDNLMLEFCNKYGG